MIIFLYGEDNLRLRQESGSVIKKYKEKYPNSLNLFSFDLESDDIKNLEDAIKTSSFFNDVKLIIVKNCFSKKNNSEHLNQIIENYDVKNDKLNVVLFCEPSPEKALKDKKSELFQTLSAKHNLVRNFEKLEGSKLENWVKREFSLRNCSISSPGVKKLILLTNKDINRLAAEIEKLSNYRLKGEIGLKDIDLLVNKDIDLNIFNLIDAVGAKDKVRAIELLYQELQTGRDPYYILTMLAYQMRNMLMIKDLFERRMSALEISKKSKIHPFVVRKSLNLVNKTPISELTHKFNNVCSIDINAKTGKVDLVDSLYSFVLI